MSKRAGPPLFELLRQQSDAPSNPAPPRARETSSEVPWSSGGVSRAERSAATMEDEPRHAGEIRVPVTRVYLAVALVLLLLVGAWAAGHHFGVQAGRDEINRAVGEVPVVSPVTPPADRQSGQSPPTQPSGGQAAPPTQPTRTQRPPADPGAVPAGTPWVLTANGSRAPDPRVPGANYLELATLPPDQAADALAFLGDRDLPAIAVPVDSGGSAANNPSRYTLVSLGLAVPGGQFRSTTEQRREHERLVKSLGAEWMRERRGGSDFSQPLWRRYDP